MSPSFATAAWRMQIRDLAVKVLFALWLLAVGVTVVSTAAAATYQPPKITYYL